MDSVRLRYFQPWNLARPLFALRAVEPERGVGVAEDLFRGRIPADGLPQPVAEVGEMADRDAAAADLDVADRPLARAQALGNKWCCASGRPYAFMRFVGRSLACPTKGAEPMSKRMMQLVVVLGVLAATLSTQAGKLPEFMNAEQLTAWRAQHSAPTAVVAQTPDEQTSFFTGKPYDAASGTYLFKYRSFNPNLSRWTSADPCGFPDGPNRYRYNGNPSSGCDRLGLAWGILDFVYHYYFGDGNVVDLSEMGLLAAVKEAANQPVDGGAWRFGQQIDDKAKRMAPFTGIFSDKFNNSYSFLDASFCIGNAVLSGVYLGNMCSVNGDYAYFGSADIFFSDVFSDPINLLQKTYGSSNPPDAPAWLLAIANLGYGSPFMIQGKWSQYYSGNGTYINKPE